MDEWTYVIAESDRFLFLFLWIKLNSGFPNKKTNKYVSNSVNNAKCSRNILINTFSFMTNVINRI